MDERVAVADERGAAEIGPDQREVRRVADQPRRLVRMVGEQDVAGLERLAQGLERGRDVVIDQRRAVVPRIAEEAPLRGD
jgi:hypothetical protein